MFLCLSILMRPRRITLNTAEEAAKALKDEFESCDDDMKKFISDSIKAILAGPDKKVDDNSPD